MSREFVTEFIKIYEKEPCLWQVNSKEYHDRNKKDAAYKKLVEKLKEVDPNATKEDVIKKINNMRSALRKENKKIKLSLKSGASTVSVYKPRLWYFSKMSFLSDQDIPRTSRSNLESDDDNEEKTSETDVPNTQEMGEQDQSIENISTSAPPTPQRQPHKRTDNSEEVAKKVLAHVNNYFKKPRIEDHFFGGTIDLWSQCPALGEASSRSCPTGEFIQDRFDVIGKGFAMKLRGLPKEQMLLAEKLINDTLFQAEMGTLRMSHRLVGEQHPNVEHEKMN